MKGNRRVTMQRRTRPRAILIYPCRCVKCGHEWESENEHPRQCHRCWSRRWYESEKDRTLGMVCKILAYNTGASLDGIAEIDVRKVGDEIEALRDRKIR